MIISILIGILGLGIVVFVHELGHFLAAKASGIEVEKFSLGWGKKLFSYKGKKTEYIISLFPIGGYCKLKGEELFRKAVDENAQAVDPSPGSLFSANPLKRIFTYIAGPAANLIFSIIVLSVIWFSGFSIRTFDNRIILLSDYQVESDRTYRADTAGLKTGDRITQIGTKEIRHYRDLQETIVQSAEKTLPVTVIRDNSEILLSITPELDPDSGAGFLGVSAWIDPIIDSVEPNTPAAVAGLKAGDIITYAGNKPIKHSLDLFSLLIEKPAVLPLKILRNDAEQALTLIPVYGERGETSLGLSFKPQIFPSPKISFPAAIAEGAKETFSTFFMTLKSLGLLFRGVKIGNALSGPIRITYYVGEVASESFSLGLSEGFTNLFRFLCLLSVALGFGNLLPIPALDGGMILFNLVEAVIKRPIKPRYFYRYQLIGFAVIMSILVFTTFNDIIFLFRK